MTSILEKLVAIFEQALSITGAPRSAAWAASGDATDADAVDQALEVAEDVADTLFPELASPLAVILLLIAFYRWVLPSWRILWLCLFYDQPLGRLLATKEVIRCFYYRLETKSLYRAARLRVEAELLKPRPEKPLPSFRSGKESLGADRKYAEEKQQWRESLQRLVSELADQSGTGKPPVIPLDRWFNLASDTTVSRIKRYFQVLDSERSLHATQVDRFLTSIRVTSGFIAPIHLLAGLLHRFQEDWEPVIEAYGNANSRERDSLRQRSRTLNLRTLQTFQFACWLLWGPSIPICTCAHWRGSIAMQYGFGDENNSFPLIDMAGGLAEKYKTLLTSYDEPRPLAVPASLEAYIRNGRGLAESASIPHAQRNIEDSLVLEFTDLYEAGGDQVRLAGTYYSAYIWVIFVLQRSDGRPLFPEEKWRGLLPFFEHGNIADGSIYEFLKRQLARKALTAIEHVLEQETDLKLGYASAFDEPASCGKDVRFPLSGRRIREIMKELLTSEFPRLRPLNLLSLTQAEYSGGADPEYSACHLPDIIEAFYADLDKSPRLPHMTYQELSTAPEDRALLQQFYNRLYKNEFPDPDERESLSNIWRYLELKAEKWYGRNNYHVVLALDGEEVIGGSISDYLAEPNAGVIEFFVVAPTRQSQGIGSRLRKRTEKVLIADAEAGGCNGLDVIVAEMDDPFKVGLSRGRLDPFIRARIWHGWGYQRLDFPYVQPALSPSQRPVHHLFLIAKPLRLENRKSIYADSVRSIVHEYMRWAMRIESPEREPAYSKMARYLSKRDGVALIPLGRYVGWDDARPLDISEIVSDTHPDFASVLRIYENAFPPGPITADRDAFIRELLISPSRSRKFHLWALRASPPQPIAGMAAFFTFSEAGFGGYVAFGEGLRRTGRLGPLLARIEEQMVRDAIGARGWYIECASEIQMTPFANRGFHEVALKYRQPPLDPKSDMPLDRAPIIHLLYKEFGRGFTEPSVTRPDFLAAMTRIFRGVYRIEDPAASPWLQDIERQTALWPDGAVRFRQWDQALRGQQRG